MYKWYVKRESPTLSFSICVLGAIRMDCSTLGISFSNTSTSATPALSDDGKNQGEAYNLDLHINHLLALFHC